MKIKKLCSPPFIAIIISMMSFCVNYIKSQNEMEELENNFLTNTKNNKEIKPSGN
jgi:hypothetical protein